MYIYISYIYVCMYTYIRICRICIYTYTYTYIPTYIHIHTYVYVGPWVPSFMKQNLNSICRALGTLFHEAKFKQDVKTRSKHSSQDVIYYMSSHVKQKKLGRKNTKQTRRRGCNILYVLAREANLFRT